MTNTFNPADGSVNTGSSYAPVFTDISSLTPLSSNPSDFNVLVDLPAQGGLRMIGKMTLATLISAIQSTVNNLVTQMSQLAAKSSKSLFSAVTSTGTYNGTKSTANAPINASITLLGVDLGSQFNALGVNSNAQATQINAIQDFINNTLVPQINALKSAGQT